MTKEIPKSTSLDKTGVSGIISRGKYTFVKIPALEIRLCVEKIMAVEK